MIDRRKSPKTLELKNRISETLKNKTKWIDLAYGSRHDRIKSTHGEASKCENINCSKKSKRFEWSNISGKYLEDRADWQELCVSCHKYFDKRGYLVKEIISQCLDCKKILKNKYAKRCKHCAKLGINRGTYA